MYSCFGKQRAEYGGEWGTVKKWWGRAGTGRSSRCRKAKTFHGPHASETRLSIIHAGTVSLLHASSSHYSPEQLLVFWGLERSTSFPLNTVDPSVIFYCLFGALTVKNLWVLDANFQSVEAEISTKFYSKFNVALISFSIRTMGYTDESKIRF